MFSKLSSPYISIFSLPILITFVIALLVLPDAATSKVLRFTNETDQQSLIKIRDQILDDPNEFFASWDENSSHFCNWTGVECSLRHQRVVTLNLTSLQLTAKISPYIGNLTFLKSLILDENFFSGSIPQEIGKLRRLRNFSVSNNSLAGQVPETLSQCVKLEVVDFSRNQLEGTIPSIWGSLTNLQQLDLSGNRLGTDSRDDDMKFLSSLVNCSNLRILCLYANNLRGILPDSVANLSTELTTLRLDNNYISGTVPEGIGNLISLFNLSLSGNSLTGTLPDSIGKLVRLEGLYLSGNKFVGPIPQSFGNISFLSILDMQENMLEGDLPVSLGNFIRLEKLNLSFNKLTGVIPGEIVGHGTLISLNLAHNLFSGSLPFQIGRLVNLFKLDVSNNKISGVLPSELGNCQDLQFLNLQRNAFEGSISDALKGLRVIIILDLSENNFSGKFPNFLANFTQIAYVNLSFNMFEGEVPNSGVFANHTAFSVIGNPKLCGVVASESLPACSKHKERKTSNHKKIMITCLVGSFTLLLLGIAYMFSIHSRNRSIGTLATQTEVCREELSEETLLGKQYPKVSYEKLRQATDNFSADNVVGKGRYGTVYKGVINDISEKTLAVKVINLQTHGAIKSFVCECEALRNIRHRNIIKIITSCSGTGLGGTDFKALIYEYMPNGSLESWLHPETCAPQSKNLSLIERLSIAIDIATALDYVHNLCDIAVIHRDIKPGNILLDNDLCAHLGDFGSARCLLIPHDRSTHIRIPQKTIGIIGTIGYIALEYSLGGPVSSLVDVYSFGILILEMFTGKRPTSRMFQDDFSLHNYVKMSLPDQVMAIADPLLLPSQEGENSNASHSSNQKWIYAASSSETEECLASVFRIGVGCSTQLPRERMRISDALMQLHSVRDLISMRSEPVRRSRAS